MASITTDLGPPFKKRRFLAEPVLKQELAQSFGAQLREFIGEEVEQHIATTLEEASNGDIQKAVNLWFDGSWKQVLAAQNRSSSLPVVPEDRSRLATKIDRLDSRSAFPEANLKSPNLAVPSKERASGWTKRYLGTFGTQGYLTTSTSLKVEQKLRITRQTPHFFKSKPASKNSNKLNNGRVAKVADPKVKPNHITRFCLPDGSEIGRFEQEAAIILSTLIDLDICSFDAVVIFAPERPRMGSNVDLMVSCYLKRSALQLGSTPSVEEPVSPFNNSSETTEERLIKLRRFSLVKLLTLIGMSPQSGSDDLRQVAQMAENSIEPQSTKKSSPSGSDDEADDGEELQVDQLDTLYSKAQTFDHNMPMMEPAETFAFTLKPYQKQALHWMYNKEKHESEDARKLESMHPLWQEYKFPNTEQEVVNESFYMNPYSGEISLEFPKALDECHGGILADEMGLGKTIEILSLVHSARLDRQLASEEKCAVPNARQCHTTLVVAPLTLIQQWQSEAENASKDGTLKTMLYYGSEKALDLGSLCAGPNARLAPDLIITSYGVVLSEFTKFQETGKSSGLFGVEFHRVVLDEAHTIKNRQAKTSKACYSLKASRRWALTGTPIVNKLEDLHSLVHYLGVEPWGVYSFWRTFITVPFESKEYVKALNVVQTVLEPLVLRRTKDMKDADGQPIVDLPSKTINIVELNFSEQEKNVYDFISARARREYKQNAMAGTVMKNYSHILNLILRLRQSCCDPVLVKHKIEQSEAPAEDDNVVEAIDDLVEDVNLSELIAQYQGGAASGEKEAISFGASVLQQISDGAEKECPICAEEPILDQTVTKCFHMACKNCLLEHIKFQESRNEDPKCHTCRQPVSAKDLLEVVRHPSDSEDEPEHILLRPALQIGSTKVDQLLKSLQETRRIEPRMKSVVFSQFTSFLDIIQTSLRRQNLPHLRLDGSMSQKDRAAVLDKFKSTPGNMTFIISLKAGGVGLNLTNANHVYMLDPWWSFAIESQAIDRIHRMGQTKEVKVFRYIIRNSVEEKMLKIQERKNFLASSLGMSKEERRRETLKDIEMLFED